MSRRSVIAVLGFVAAVHIVAYAGNGILRAPLQTGASPVIDEGPPLARFDAGWYRSIAERGYYWDAAAGVGNVAFFPLYPLLMKLVSLSGLNFYWAGLLVSHVFFFVSVGLFYRLEVTRAGPSGAGSRVLALLTFPWAFFLLAPYSESLFLALVLAVWLLALRRQWALVALLGLAAGLTRIFALALVPALLVLAWPSESPSPGRPRRPQPLALLAALTPAGGVAGFFAWLGLRFSDPFVFLHAQQRGWGRRPGLSGIQRSLEEIPGKILERGPLHLGPLLDLLVVLLLLATVVSSFRSRKLSDSCYTGSGIALIAASGSLASSGRYALVLFPVFEALPTALRRPVVWRCLLLASALLQSYLIVRFVNDLWVA